MTHSPNCSLSTNCLGLRSDAGHFSRGRSISHSRVFATTPDVVFERIGPRQIIIVGIAISPHEICALIHVAGNRPHAELAVFEICFLQKDGRKSSIGGIVRKLRQYIRLGPVLSASTSHLGAPPVWVMAVVQPDGRAPAGVASKLMISGRKRFGAAQTAAAEAITQNTVGPFI